MKLRIAWLYSDLMDIYGDRGNIITLENRCRWRGIDVQVKNITIGNQFDPDEFDILFFGGGQDREQVIVAEDLKKGMDKAIKKAVENGVVMLNICGGYQLLGKYYLSSDGKRLPGIGIFNMETTGGERRMIGNIVIQSDILEGEKIVGFENHGGKTYLGEGVKHFHSAQCKPLGRVLSGYGNNGEDKTEGAVYKNTFGTYLHGPILPKNPHFADFLIKKALERKYGEVDLTPLDDKLEIQTYNSLVKRFS